MNQANADDPFHDSESEDVFDLYNAVNGAVRRDGLLDRSKLDELTAEEAEAFDVPRLIEIWDHTATGCLTCAAIIRTLNIVRGELREGAQGASEDQSETEKRSGVDRSLNKSSR